MPDGQQTSSPSVPKSREAPKYIVPGLQRGLEILRAFSRDRHRIGAPELARELNIPRSTVFRLIQTLEYMGFLEKLSNGSEYRLSVGVLSLGFEFIASLEVTDLAGPLLEKLRDETGHSAHLAIRDGGDVIFVNKQVCQRVNGIRFLVPNHQETEAGVFVVSGRTGGDVDIDSGCRYR